MTTKGMINDLVARFVYHLQEQDKVMRRDFRKGNWHARESSRAFQQLVADHGDVGRDAFSVLLEHNDPSVRCAAAAFMLRYKHNEAMEVLRDLAAARELGLVCFGAKCSIRNWYTGDWELDPGPMSPEMQAELSEYRSKPVSDIPYGDWETP